jgi:hypothetical protein
MAEEIKGVPVVQAGPVAGQRGARKGIARGWVGQLAAEGAAAEDFGAAYFPAGGLGHAIGKRPPGVDPDFPGMLVQYFLRFLAHKIGKIGAWRFVGRRIRWGKGGF